MIPFQDAVRLAAKAIGEVLEVNPSLKFKDIMSDEVHVKDITRPYFEMQEQLYSHDEFLMVLILATELQLVFKSICGLIGKSMHL